MCCTFVCHETKNGEGQVCDGKEVIVESIGMQQRLNELEELLNKFLLAADSICEAFSSQILYTSSEEIKCALWRIDELQLNSTDSINEYSVRVLNNRVAVAFPCNVGPTASYEVLQLMFTLMLFKIERHFFLQGVLTVIYILQSDINTTNLPRPDGALEGLEVNILEKHENLKEKTSDIKMNEQQIQLQLWLEEMIRRRPKRIYEFLAENNVVSLDGAYIRKILRMRGLCSNITDDVTI
ncbi:hypothetical protein THOM_0903 [Trachipleistophora hominis]|uniref:Uncharacterized protein n=1 Tax=Trachipleistophora hominis TaxID=72359 RepID=L7JZD6_TRAHO|nr:hypothetical protein THOM_0903 [Trachipleistophora hominis]